MKRISEIRLTIIPTWGCNLRCRHCYQASRGFPSDVLPLENAMKLFELVATEVSRVKVILHGGEPTLCGGKYIGSLFSQMQAIASRYEIEVSFVIQTNGMLLNADFCTLLKSFGTAVGVSYDGMHHALFRGDSSDTVLNNIKTAQAQGLMVMALCVESETTIKDVILNYEWFKSRRIGYKILPLYLTSGNIDLDVDPVTPTTYAKQMIALYCHWLFDTQCDISIPTLEGLLCVFNNSTTSCRIGGDCIGKCLALMPNGDVGLCSHELPKKYIFANVTNLNKLDDIFTSTGYDAINVLNERRKLLCEPCEFSKICHGGCLANVFHEGSPEKIGGPSCQRTKALLSHLGRINSRIVEKYQRNPSKFNRRAREILSGVRSTKKEKT